MECKGSRQYCQRVRVTLMKTPNQMPEVGRERGELHSLSALRTDVEKHNRDHGWGAKLAKSIGGMVRATVEGKNPNLGEIQKEVAVDSAHSAQSGLTALRARHQKVLDGLGLTMTHQTGSREPETVMVKIANAKRLLEEIKSLKERPERGKDTREMLEFLIASLSNQIYAADYENLLPEDKNIIGNLNPLVETFRAIDPKLNLLEKIRIYARFQKEGRLANYVEVERTGLWAEPGKGFGPADWVTDATSERLNELWIQALDMLHTQEAMNNGGVSKELRDHLLHCVTSASQTLKGLSWPEAQKKEMQGILEKYTKALRGNKALN